MRLSRKGRRRLQPYKDALLAASRQRESMAMRMTRSRRRHRQQQELWRQRAAAGALGTLGMMPAAATEAASIQTFLEVPAAMQSLRDSRDRIRDLAAAKRNVREAADALVQAEANLQQARQSQRDAAQALSSAQQNLEEAKRRLQRVTEELAKARTESAARTQAAIAAQQAVADFLPNISAQQEIVNELAADRNTVQGNYDAAVAQMEEYARQQESLETIIEQAWQSVNYEQNRLYDVMAMVNAARQSQGMASDRSGEIGPLAARLQELDTAIDESEAALDALNDQLDALVAAREAAEDAERDARQLVVDLTEQQGEAQTDIQERQQDLADSVKWNQEAAAYVLEADKSLQATQVWKQQADYALEHFGEGMGASLGFEYYTWRGARQRGYQLYQPLEFYTAEKQWDYSLSTGWIDSDTGLWRGHVRGWTDTTLGIAWKNNHKQYDVHYLLNINVPTGIEDAHQHAMTAEGLARFNSFSEGWQVTPGIEVTQHITERDSLTGRLSYIIRGDYTYHSSASDTVTAADIESLGGWAAVTAYAKAKDIRLEKVQDVELKDSIDPSNQFRQDLEYRHIGEKEQLSVQFTHINASHSYYRNHLYSYWEGGVEHVLDDSNVALSGRNDDGDDWILRIYGNQELDARNSWQYYLISNYQEGTTASSVRRYYGGLGWRYRFDKNQAAYILLGYGETNGDSYNWLTGKSENGRRIKSVMLGYDYRCGARDALSAKVENYTINGSDTDSYHGWKMSLMYNHTF
ncbi:hypothetical protein SAMN02910356_00833 [Selenomonas sp. GACV-9]|uniref:hypothetical protein n=1 Tax=Selenomonas sp. GACV-9 TaxID=3158782 RepID=UPI0008EFD9BC|nr:hypothetical protein SAMN02910356_00833 [Selenomonas ruminantium]